MEKTERSLSLKRILTISFCLVGLHDGCVVTHIHSPFVNLLAILLLLNT